MLNSEKKVIKLHCR